MADGVQCIEGNGVQGVKSPVTVNKYDVEGALMWGAWSMEAKRSLQLCFKNTVFLLTLLMFDLVNRILPSYSGPKISP